MVQEPWCTLNSPNLEYNAFRKRQNMPPPHLLFSHIGIPSCAVLLVSDWLSGQVSQIRQDNSGGLALLDWVTIATALMICAGLMLYLAVKPGYSQYWSEEFIKYWMIFSFSLMCSLGSDHALWGVPIENNRHMRGDATLLYLHLVYYFQALGDFIMHLWLPRI